ncbi:hypothetical protein D3C86_1198950 [compost metagenome]
MIDRAAALVPEDARRVGVIDHDDGLVLLGDLDDVRQRRDVPVHREDAVGDDQGAAVVALDLVEHPAQVRHVLVLEDGDLGAAQAAAVDDARVVELVGDDHVLLAEHRRDRPRVGREARLEDQGGFGVLEGRDLGLELHVLAHGARDGADRARTCAELVDGLVGRLHEPGVGRQAQVVVGAEVDDLLVVEASLGLLLAFEHAGHAVQAPVLEVLQLVGEVTEGIVAHRVSYDGKAAD